MVKNDAFLLTVVRKAAKAHATITTVSAIVDDNLFHDHSATAAIWRITAEPVTTAVTTAVTTVTHAGPATFGTTVWPTWVLNSKNKQYLG